MLMKEQCCHDDNLIHRKSNGAYIGTPSSMSDDRVADSDQEDRVKEVRFHLGTFGDGSSNN